MHGVVTSSRLRCLHPVLERWCKINNQLGREWSSANDAPWCYNERASVSVFAGAIWRSGEAAFEEYSELKRAKKQLATGRIDLWFSARMDYFWAEAKFCSIPFTRTGTQINRVQTSMKLAKADVRRCPPDGATRRLALVFGCPYIRPAPPAQLRSRIGWLMQESRNAEHDAIAWAFPRLDRYAKSSDGWIYPGAIVWIKEVRR